MPRHWIDRRAFVVGSAVIATGMASGSAAAQDAYPTRPITLINPFPPGGTADVVARPLAAVLEPLFQQPIVIETKAGAAGQVGAQFAASAKPDGYTLLIHLVSLSGFPEVDRLYGRAVKFTRDDFVPVVRLTAGPMVLLVNDQQPHQTLGDLVEDAKKRPNELIFSSSGMHGALHLPTALFLKAAGIQMRHLPTNGGGPSITALIGNNSQVAISSLASAAAQVKAGKARILACLSASRLATHPSVPTLKEAGYDVEFYLWAGLFAPKGTPQPIIDRWRAETTKAIAAEPFKQAMANLGEEIAFLDQSEFKAFWEADAKRVEEAVRLIGKV
jgi:tripartite-type tricarboxylate transporter receptor subunit TctC